MNFVGTHDTQLTYIPVSQFLDAEDCFNIRLPAPEAVEELRGSLVKSGQTHPIFLEERGVGDYRMIDGHRRREAIRLVRANGGTWEKMLAHVIPSGSMSDADRFRLLLEKNLAGKNPYGLIERGRFFKCFIEYGLSLKHVADQARVSPHEVEDLIELAAAHPTLAALLNNFPMDPMFAVMLHRRYEGWRASAFESCAEATARRLLDHFSNERVTMKSWRFLLDFYWPADRPFMA